MANVEVQLDVKAEYKQALMAIAALGKALDAVQQRAKVAMTVSGGAQGGSLGAGGTGDAETQQKAAVEALGAAMKDAATAAATLAESVAKLTPALEAMGPQAEQVQQVLTLAEHYKQLAAAMGVAADAAAKYNASGAQQGETDARIQKLMEENQKLMELVSNIRAEYAEIVKRNAELNRTKKAREEASRSAKEELEVTEDLSYQMQLAAMSKRELTAEIARLTKERKEAAKAGDEAKYKELTEELKLARQAMTKLRQEQQLARIAWMQQAQTAQQMGQSVRTLADGFMNFGEAVENGTVNLTGMVTAVTSLSLAIKAGLGPLGWALAAVELLTTAWNMYAKSRKAAEEEEKKSQERIVKLTTAYHDAAAEAQKFKDQEARKAEVDALIARYDELNNRLRERNTLLETGLRMKQAELMMDAKEDEQMLSIEQHEIRRAYYRGEIDEEEMQSRLDRLNIKRARNKKKQVVEKGRLEISAAEERIKLAEKRRAESYIGTGALEEVNERLYSIDPATMNKLASAYTLAQQEYQDAFLNKRPDESMRYDRMQKAKEALKGWTVAQIESGEYNARYAAHKDKYNKAQEEIKKAEEEVTKANERLADLERQHALNIRQEEQNVRFQIQNAGQNVQTRAAKKEFDDRKKKEREEEQRRKEQERAAKAARKSSEKREQMQRAVAQEAIAEKADLPRELNGFINGGAYNMLKDGLSQKEAEMFEKAFKAAAKVKNKALFEMLEFLLKQADEDGKTTNQIMAKLKQTRKNTEKLVD